MLLTAIDNYKVKKRKKINIVLNCFQDSNEKLVCQSGRISENFVELKYDRISN